MQSTSIMFGLVRVWSSRQTLALSSREMTYYEVTLTLRGEEYQGDFKYELEVNKNGGFNITNA
jgi:hypothetical protein